MSPNITDSEKRNAQNVCTHLRARVAEVDAAAIPAADRDAARAVFATPLATLEASIAKLEGSKTPRQLASEAKMAAALEAETTARRLRADAAKEIEAANLEAQGNVPLVPEAAERGRRALLKLSEEVEHVQAIDRVLGHPGHPVNVRDSALSVATRQADRVTLGNEINGRQTYRDPKSIEAALAAWPLAEHIGTVGAQHPSELAVILRARRAYAERNLRKSLEAAGQAEEARRMAALEARTAELLAVDLEKLKNKARAKAESELRAP